MEVKIGKIDFSITNNGTPKVLIFPEGADYNNNSEAIEIVGEEVIYAMTRKAGEIITIIEKGKWKNLEIPADYLKALNSPTYDRIKILFKRSVSGLNKAVNGNRTQIDLDTAKILLTSNLEVQLKVQNFILETLQKSNTVFAKQVVQDLGSKDSATQYNAWEVVNDLTNRHLNELGKEYSILNDDTEVEVVNVSTDTKPKSKKKS